MTWITSKMLWAVKDDNVGNEHGQLHITVIEMTEWLNRRVSSFVDLGVAFTLKHLREESHSAAHGFGEKLRKIEQSLIHRVSAEGSWSLIYN